MGGPRKDDFDEDAWWCRTGLTWPNLCQVEDLRGLVDKETKCLTLRVEVISHSAIPEPVAPPEGKVLSSLERPSSTMGSISTRPSTSASSLSGALTRVGSSPTLPRLLSLGSPFSKELDGVTAKYRAQFLKIQYKGEVVFDNILSQMVCDYLARQTVRTLLKNHELQGGPVGTLEADGGLGETTPKSALGTPQGGSSPVTSLLGPLSAPSSRPGARHLGSSEFLGSRPLTTPGIGGPSWAIQRGSPFSRG